MVPYEAFLAEKPVVTTTDAGGPLEVVARPANGSRVRAARSSARRSVLLAPRARRRREGLGPRGQGDRAARVVGRDDRALAGVRVAYYSPLPPERSGIADYSALLLPALRRLVEVEVVRRGRTRPVAADVALYHVGNDPDAHGWIVDALRRRPGVVVLHEFVLHHLVAGLTIGRKDGPAYLAAMERDAGVAGRLLAHGVLDGRVPPPWETRPEEFPLAGEVLASATGLDRPLALRRGARARAVFDGPVWRIPHPAWPHAGRCACRRRRAAAVRLLRAPQREQANPAAARGIRGRAPPPSEREAPARRSGVASASTRSGSSATASSASTTSTNGRLWSLMAACDACISLRAPTMGETSGSVIRALSLGRPLVVSDLGWFAELPDDVALKVPVDDDEVPALAAALELLASSEATQLAMSDAARPLRRARARPGRVAEAVRRRARGGCRRDGRRRRGRRRGRASCRRDRRRAGNRRSQPSSPGGSTRSGLRATAAPSRVAAAPQRGLRASRRGRGSSPLVVVSAVFRYGLSRRVVAPWIMVDELIYSELAKSFAATGHFLIRDVHHGAYGAVYPLLIAPAWRVVRLRAGRLRGREDDRVGADVAHRDPGVLPRAPRALPAVVARWRRVLAVAVPSMMYTGTLMTETVFYPIFVCVALALVLALERPTLTRQVVLLAACLLAFLTRSQAIVLDPGRRDGAAGARLARPPPSHPGRQGVPRRVRRARRSRSSASSSSSWPAGKSPFDVLGSYSVTGHAELPRRPGAEVAALPRLRARPVPRHRPVRCAAPARGARTLARPAAARVPGRDAAADRVAVLEVAAFASALSPRVQERNLFYVAPLFLIALLAWIERGMPRPPRAAAVAAVVAAALPGALPYHR